MNDVIERMLQKYKLAKRSDEELALREILQEITLVGLWRSKFFEHAAFYGGTALRILYGLDRFSEDLDFTLLSPDHSFSWHIFEKNVTEELKSYGFEVSFKQKEKHVKTQIQSAFLKANTDHALLQIGVKNRGASHPDALIRIKVEIDSLPTLGFDVESVYLKDPLPVSIRALTKPSLFAGKVHAALFRGWKERVKGRDWYDLIWFLRQGVPINPNYLRECLNEKITLAKVKELLMNKIEKISLTAAIEDVRPFLKDPDILNAWSVDFFKHWIDKLEFERS